MTEPVCFASRSTFALTVSSGDAHSFTQALAEAQSQKFLTPFP